MPDSGTPLRIVHVITRLINGGADENTVLSCNHAVRAGHAVFLVHGSETKPEILEAVDGRVRIECVSHLVHPISPLSDVRALSRLVRIFRGIRPDVVHTHTSKAGILGRLAAQAARVPVVVHGVHIAPFLGARRIEKLVFLAAERLVQRATDAFIDVSRGMGDLFVEFGLGSPERHHVIRSGFDISRFRDAAPPEDWRDLLRLQPNASRPAVLVMLAALEPRKRHLEFLGTVPRIVASFPDVRVILAGDGKLRRNIQERINELGIEGNVILTGFDDQPERLIALADICVLTSMREGLPRVVVQYLAAGKPVVASDLHGLGEVLRNDVNGIVTSSDDLAALANGIVELLEDEPRRIRLASAAAATDLSEWDSELMGQRIEALYASVIRQNNPEQPRWAMMT